jgi:two-component system alkaline phosphatase synthesis response regulator PhoP
MPKILIVDDESYTRLLLEQILEELEEEGVELLTADNGEVALEIITREVPEIVFLDVMMPKLNGFEVCNVVKNELALKGVYIVMLTVMGQELDRQKGEKAGADLYMTKPYSPDDILNKAREILGM